MISPPVFRYFVKLSYNGSGFNGWQKQENAPSVQQVLEQAFAFAGGITCRLTGCGRTDTGVHAKKFYAHFDYHDALNEEELDKITFKINRYMPFSIAVQRIFPVMPEAHARFSPVLREYQYNILLAKDPFLENSAYYIWGDLDVGAMNKAATLLKQFTDFECFSKTNTQVKTYNCRIIEAGWKRDGNLLVFTIQADRFLRNMVRAIVGTLLDIGRHKLNPDDLRRIIESRNRCNAGYSVPAKGLFLTDVIYPDGIFSDHPVAFLPGRPDEIKPHNQADAQLHDGAGNETYE
ncbi:MAG TPA: tRNA pseudouridine(38-40) synthase TruA [Bacteroidales bacterium]|nr:tRNA pseudouridine(38-40) synthase TruA [Bacteroidales bacterium]